MRTAACFDSADAFGFKRLVLCQKLAVFLGENIIGYNGDSHLFPKPLTKLEHQRGLAAAHRSADTDSECALSKITLNRQFALVKAAPMIPRLVIVCVDV